VNNVKEELLALERKWLKAEFGLDTTFLSTLLNSPLIGISANRTSNKQEELNGMYNNINAMRKNSIFLDSLELEDAVVIVYGKSAEVTFVVHPFKKDRGKNLRSK